MVYMCSNSVILTVNINILSIECVFKFLDIIVRVIVNLRDKIILTYL